MSNPYQPPEGVKPRDQKSDVQCVAVRPVARLYEAKELLRNQYLLFVLIGFVALLISSTVPIVLVGPMMCGLFYCFIQKEQGQVSFEMLFKGFDFFVEGLVATLIMTAVVIVVEIPFGILWLVMMLGGIAANDGEFPPILLALLPVFYLGLFALILVIQIPFAFVFPLMVDRRLKALEAIRLSWRGAKANFMGILGMYLLHMLLGMAAACLCYVPLFLLLPLCFGSTFLVYREIFPTEARPASTIETQ